MHPNVERAKRALDAQGKIPSDEHVNDAVCSIGTGDRQTALHSATTEIYLGILGLDQGITKA